MNENVKRLVMPVAVLAVICLVVTAALAVSNSVTAPIVEKAQAEAAQAARAEVLPGGSGFTKVEAAGLPERVTEVYRADNGAGYVFSLTAKGYNGPMKLMVGIGSDGKIAGVKALDISKEDPGMGSRVGEDFFTSQFPGKDAALEGVDTISGSTVSSASYIAAVKDAFTAFEALNGREGT